MGGCFMSASRSRYNGGYDPGPNSVDAEPVAKQAWPSAPWSPFGPHWANCVRKIWNMVHIPSDNDDKHSDQPCPILSRWTERKSDDNDKRVARRAN